MFNEKETKNIIRDFFYMENANDWPDEIRENYDAEEYNELFSFTLINLNSTDPDNKKDCS